MLKKILIYIKKELENLMLHYKIKKLNNKIKRNINFFIKEINKWINF